MKLKQRKAVKLWILMLMADVSVVEMNIRSFVMLLRFCFELKFTAGRLQGCEGRLMKDSF